MKDEWKHHNGVDKHSLEQQFHKSKPLLCKKSGVIHLVQPILTAGWQTAR